MAEKYGISESEFNLIKMQAARRAEMRKEFLKQRTNPFKHASEAGYVFDPALQRYMSMKATQYEFFQPNRRNSLFGVCAIIIPMFAYGYLLWNHRTTRENKIRAGELRYKDRHQRWDDDVEEVAGPYWIRIAQNINHWTRPLSDDRLRRMTIL